MHLIGLDSRARSGRQVLHGARPRVGSDTQERVVAVDLVRVAICLGLAELDKRVRSLEHLAVLENHLWVCLVQQDKPVDFEIEALQRRLLLVGGVDL